MAGTAARDLAGIMAASTGTVIVALATTMTIMMVGTLPTTMDILMVVTGGARI